MSTPLNEGLGSEHAISPNKEATKAKPPMSLNHEVKERVLWNMKNFDEFKTNSDQPTKPQTTRSNE
jgi:hypothetical protein